MSQYVAMNTRTRWSILLYLCHRFQKGHFAPPLIYFRKRVFHQAQRRSCQLHLNSWAFIRAFTIICSQLGLSPTVEIFLYFFEGKHLGRQLWVSFNGAPGRALLTLFQSFNKNFKGKFLKLRCNKGYMTLLDRFPLYWTQKPRFQSARHLEDQPLSDQEVYKFLMNLKVVFDTAFLLSKEFTLGALKAYTGTPHSLLLV